MFAEIIIGFVQPSYDVAEGAGQVEICAEIKDGNLRTTVTVEFSTADRDATGKYTIQLPLSSVSRLTCCFINFIAQHRETILQHQQPLRSVRLRTRIV